MALETLIASPFEPPPPERPERRALVLMGGGARTAYQVGVLRALARLLDDGAFPFHLILGTAAGALNGAYLASVARLGTRAFEQLAAFWTQLRSHHVYQLSALRVGRRNLLIADLTLMRQVRRHRALLDTMPLVQTLHRHLDLPAVSTTLAEGTLDVLAVTASSYTSGEHWTFFQTADASCAPWRRPGRCAEAQLIGVEHLMASAAIPFLFPAVPLWVDGHKEYFGDGSMRQLSPLSGAIHLDARQILVIGSASRSAPASRGRRRAPRNPAPVPSPATRWPVCFMTRYRWM